MDGEGEPLAPAREGVLLTAVESGEDVLEGVVPPDPVSARGEDELPPDSVGDKDGERETTVDRDVEGVLEDTREALLPPVTVPMEVGDTVNPPLGDPPSILGVPPPIEKVLSLEWDVHIVSVGVGAAEPVAASSGDGVEVKVPPRSGELLPRVLAVGEKEEKKLVVASPVARGVIEGEREAVFVAVPNKVTELAREPVTPNDREEEMVGVGETRREPVEPAVCDPTNKLPGELEGLTVPVPAPAAEEGDTNPVADTEP